LIETDDMCNVAQHMFLFLEFPKTENEEKKTNTDPLSPQGWNLCCAMCKRSLERQMCHCEIRIFWTLWRSISFLSFFLSFFLSLYNDTYGIFGDDQPV